MKPTFKPAVIFLSSVLIPTSSSAQDGLRPFHPDTFEEIVSHAGKKPFVVLIWSLNCSYCLSSFQALSQVQAERNIEVATIATDPLGDDAARQAIFQKLQTGGMKGPAWAFGPWPSARLRYAIDPKWRGELPRSYWYKDGRLVGRHSGAITKEVAMKYFPNGFFYGSLRTANP